MSDMLKILNYFSFDFNNVYYYMESRLRKEIAYLSPTIYTRWFYSALFPDTILSPSMIMESQPENNASKGGFFSANVHYSKIDAEHIDFFFQKEYYSVDDHPIFTDLNIFYDYISPVLYLNEDSSLKEKDIHALQKKLSISDRYYVKYLFKLGEGLGMYKEMPSLAEPCIQPDSTFTGFFELEGSDMLSIIVDISCDMCAEAVNAEFLPEITMVDSETIGDFVVNPMSIDDMFIKLYKKAGFDLEEVWKRADKNELNEMDKAVLSSVYYMGIIIDMSFVCVFGAYLRLIRPLYTVPINIRETVNSLHTNITVDGDRELELFMPCTSYMHTPLGRKFFNIPRKKNQKIQPIPIDKIYESLYQENINRMARDEESHEMIYSFKAILDGKSGLWKKVEIPASMSIINIYMYMTTIFMIKPEKDFSIKAINDAKRSSKCIDFNKIGAFSNMTAPLSEIVPDDGRSLLITFNGGRTIEMKPLDSKWSVSEIMYPRLVSQSKQITESEKASPSDEF